MARPFTQDAQSITRADQLPMPVVGCLTSVCDIDRFDHPGLRPPNRRQQRGVVQCSLVAFAIDKECRRSGNAAAHAAHEVALDCRPVTARLDIIGELRDIEIDLYRKLM